MSRMFKFYYQSGVALLLAGALLGYFGYSGLIEGIKRAQEGTDLSGTQIARGLMLPHVMVLISFAFLMFGVIILVRYFMLRERLSRGD